MASRASVTMDWEHDGLWVVWLDGGLYLEFGGHGLLLDCPPGALMLLDAACVLPRLRTIAISGGRMLSCGGLISLLCGLERHRRDDAPLELWTPMGDERPGLLADAWARGWPDRYPLQVDVEAPGGAFEVGGMRVQTLPVRRGEPRWGALPGVFPVSAAAFRVVTPSATVVFVPGAAPDGGVEHACRGANLAVVEVGVGPWPTAPEAWRLSSDQAIRAAARAKEVWLVGDDGRPLSAGVA